MANVRKPTEGPMSPGGEYPELAGMTRRDTISGAAKLVAGLSIGAQVMAATGADNAMAKQVRPRRPAAPANRATDRWSSTPAKCRCRRTSSYVQLR